MADLSGLNGECFEGDFTCFEGSETGEGGIEYVDPAGAVRVNGEGAVVADLGIKICEAVFSLIGIDNSEGSVGSGGINRDSTKKIACDGIGRIIGSGDVDGDHLGGRAIDGEDGEGVGNGGPQNQLGCGSTTVVELIAPLACGVVKGEGAVGAVEVFRNVKG